MSKPSFTPRPERPAHGRVPNVANQRERQGEGMQKFADTMKHQMAMPPAPTPEPAKEAPKNVTPREEYTPRDDKGNVLGSDYERVDLPSNFIFYDWSDLHVRRFDPFDQAKLARAVRYKSFSLVLDVLSSTCTRDVRDMAVGDFRALCLWHRLNSYMNTTAKVTFLSRYGNKNEVTVKKTRTETKYVKMTRADYLEFVKKGFALPTTRDLETTSGNDIDEDVMYLFEHAQYLDASTPEMKERIEQLRAEGDRIPSITARVNKLAEMSKDTRFALWDEIDEFATNFADFGVQEIAMLKDEHFDPERAIEYLRSTEDEKAMAEADKIEAAMKAGIKYEPQPEEVPLAFSLWNMFCYV